MSALAIVLVPLWVWILDRVFARHAELYPTAVAKVMLTTVFIPLTIGLLVRRFVPVAQRASGTVMTAAGVILGIVSAILIWGLWPQVRIFIGNGLILLIVAIVVAGLIVGHLLGGPIAGDRTALAMATASRHPAVALAVATSGSRPSPSPS
jgi:BASS family bile acid:Na+ symporter